MALLARLTKRALVLVILTVTADAGRRRRNLRRILRRMAGVALQPLVRTGQRELGLRGVIKAPPRPAVRIMALRAFRGQTPFVARVLVATLAGA